MSSTTREPSFTEDLFPDDTIFVIKKAFIHDDHRSIYTYVVSKLNGRWYVTGKDENGKGRGWAELLSWMSRGFVVSAKLASDFQTVVIIDA